VYHPRPPHPYAGAPFPDRPDVQANATPANPPVRSLPALRIGYACAAVAEVLREEDVLAVFEFGARGATPADPRHVHVALETIGPAQLEVWRGSQAVTCGHEGMLRWSTDDHYLFFAIEVDEAPFGGPEQAAEHAYREIGRLLDGFRFERGGPAHVLRFWNYLDAINEGDGDDERYRHFCSGRARGIDSASRNGFPAATAIGRHDGRRVLQVYGLGARLAGTAIENPRQVSAWRYPREYGPTPPTFARATRTGAGQLFVSGTAAVIGHASQHAGDTAAQIEETLNNVDVLLATADESDVGAAGAGLVLKAYVRDPVDAATVDSRIRSRHPALAGLLVLVGDICRRELRVEIDGVHAPARVQATDIQDHSVV